MDIVASRRGKEIKATAIKTLRSLFGVLSIWLVGWFGFSYSWILGSFILYIWWKNNKTQKKKQLKVLREITYNEQDILMHLMNLPSWVCFPDVERAEWLNQMVKQMWPFLSMMVQNILKEKVEPEIQKKLPSFLKSFNFVEIDLGNHPLKIGGIKVYTEHVRPTEMVLDAEIVYAGDAIVRVGVNPGITAGVSDLQLRGTLRVEFNPLLSKLPLIGGVTLYFLETPKINFNLTNLLNVFDAPGVSEVVTRVIDEVMESFMVLPNRIKIPIGDPKDLEALKYPMPLGVLEVKILEADQLIANDFRLFKKNSSDPYVTCRVGNYKCETKAIDNTLSPKWKNESFQMLVNSVVGHKVYFEVHDKDPVSDDCLGTAEIEMAKIAHSSFIDLWIPLQNVKTGSLHVSCGWLTFSEKSSDIIQDIEGVSNNQACLFVKLDSAKGLPAVDMEKGTSSPHVEITVGNKTVQSKTQRNTKTPVWEEIHSFLIVNPSHAVIQLKVLDCDAAQPLGIINVEVTTLLGYPNMKVTQSFPLQDCFTKAEINMTLELKALVSPKVCEE